MTRLIVLRRSMFEVTRCINFLERTSRRRNLVFWKENVTETPLRIPLGYHKTISVNIQLIVVNIQLIDIFI